MTEPKDIQTSAPKGSTFPYELENNSTLEVGMIKFQEHITILRKDTSWR